MRRKGFTLIELLAVIVILVVIALITTPLILNVINDSKEKARLQSIKNIEDQAYFYYTKYALVNNKATGNLFNPVMETIKGEKPEDGEIQIKEGKKIAYALKYGNVCYKKGYDESVVRKLENEEECTLINTKNYLKKIVSTTADSPFLDGPIVRNTIEKISVLDHQGMGENVIGSWDVSEQGNSSILAWYKDEDENSLYEVYIGGDGMVVANPDSRYLFQYLPNLIEINLDYLYTSVVTNMAFMFNECSNLKKLNIENWDTSNVTDMYKLFYHCSSLTKLNLGNWDTSNVTDMGYMFSECNSLTELNIKNWNTSNAKRMAQMFSYCNNLSELDLSNWDISNATDISYMFFRCRGLKKLVINTWNTAKVTDMARIFESCDSLTELNIENWNTSSVTNMYQLFYHCSSLTKLNLGNWDTSKVTNMAYMFNYCDSLVELDLNNWDVSSATNMSSMLAFCGNLAELNIKNWKSFPVVAGGISFSGDNNLKTVYANSTIKANVEQVLKNSNITGVTVQI